MINKEYYCYICAKKFKKLIRYQDLMDLGLSCDHCHQGFCEIIDADTVDVKGIVSIGMDNNLAQTHEEQKEESDARRVGMLDALNNRANGTGINESVED